MKARIIRGENQIGGNIVEISTDKTKIILDVGLELNGDKVAKRPNLPELFDFHGYDAVLITHYHGDHVGLAYDIYKDIPLYMGEASYKVLKTANEYSKSDTFEVAGFLNHKHTIKIGDIKITPFLCDHSAFDSYMLLCEADGDKILYTGDFRSNGRKSYDYLLKELPNDIDTLICEGTTLSRDDKVSLTELELENMAVELFKSTDGPIFVLMSSMNIDRIVTMYRAAKRSNRLFFEELYMADITSIIGKSIPNPAFDDVYPFIVNNKHYDGLLKYKNRVGRDFISKSKFVMCIRNSMSNYLKSLSKMMDFNNGILVYSFWSGYKEKENMKSFLEICENLGLKVVTLHTSGHADSKAIRKLIKKTNPKRIMPIHTENADWFEQFNNN